jgi:periplasmic protein TonB
MSISESDLAAAPDERLMGPERLTPAERRGLTLALVAAIALHVIIPAGLIAYYAFFGRPAPAVQEIPIEVVVEQPPPPKPPPPPQPQDKPKEPPPPDDEKPAYDAPAASTHDDSSRESPDKTTQAQASKAPPPPTPGAPPKADQPSQTASAAPAEQPKEQNAPPPEMLKPTPDGDEPASQTPAPDVPAKDAASPPAPAPPAPAPGEAMPTIETLPEYKFARANKDAPIATGNADTRYFTIVYGMIRSHLREPTGAEGHKRGAIVFGVDETGNLIGRKMMESSGSPTLDMAVMAAIAQASPYPAPPGWVPKTMRLTYGGP